eukprot:CAMPEP_0185364958 /NCGR_PEP_ID=MMETSP1364-20130426/12744_1 /TAXON_ID=38817 /ORGANISM="Gephyrocapsa oceanica, Strain RCC1303" /LENGTH=147 /DNA_ID=CAMNT_0027965477 /DNA_START=84 /DNA_END=524 /DNA_ORIENTATION=-
MKSSRTSSRPPRRTSLELRLLLRQLEELLDAHPAARVVSHTRRGGGAPIPARAALRIDPANHLIDGDDVSVPSPHVAEHVVVRPLLLIAASVRHKQRAETELERVHHRRSHAAGGGAAADLFTAAADAAPTFVEGHDAAADSDGIDA